VRTSWTKAFVGFVPLPYQPENNDIPVKTPPTGFDALRTIAVSRIYLDNFDHITAYWVGLGLKLAQVALSYGADDLPGRSSRNTSSTWPAQPRHNYRPKLK
jgi:aminodeoxyfutalosine synthase